MAESYRTRSVVLVVICLLIMATLLPLRLDAQPTEDDKATCSSFALKEFANLVTTEFAEVKNLLSGISNSANSSQNTLALALQCKWDL